MNNQLKKQIKLLYKKNNFLTRLYVDIRLLLTPFEEVSEYLPKKGVIYDLGCGFGIFSNILAISSTKRKVIGIDLSSKRINAARETVRKRKNIKFIDDNLKNICLEKCGSIIIYDVLHHMNYRAQEELLEECFNKLDENGLLVIKDNNTTPVWKFFWNYIHEIITMVLLITRGDKLSFRTKNGFINLLFKKGFIVEAINIPTKLPYPFILYKCRKVKKEKKDEGVVLISPPLTLEERYGKIAKGGRNAPPLGLCCLAAVVRKNDYKVSIIDAPAMGSDYENIVNEITWLSPKYIGLTASTLAIESAHKLASLIKMKQKKVIIIVGGSHITALPEETLLKYQSFDFGVTGEGEETLIELLSVIKNNQKFEEVRGLVYRKKNKVMVNDRRPFIKDLDSLPLPAWDLLPPLEKFYRSSPQSFDRLPSCSLVTSRGCPNQCTFCDRSIFGNCVRGYSPDYVIKMLKILSHQYGIKHLLIDDDTFTVLRDRLEKICRLIIKEKIDLTWTCLARVDTVNKALLSLMKKAGCWQILYGIESGNQNILNSLKKNITLGEIEKALKITHECGIKTKGFFILGTPLETKETAGETINFLKRIKLDDFHMTYFTPFPGTEIYSQIKKNNSLDRKWSEMNEWSPVFIPPEMTREELIYFSKKAFREFYFRPKIMLSYFKAAFFSGNVPSLFYGINALLKYLISNI